VKSPTSSFSYFRKCPSSSFFFFFFFFLLLQDSESFSNKNISAAEEELDSEKQNFPVRKRKIRT
jgi:hypothetical protein